MMNKKLPKPFVVDRPDDHNATVWIGEAGEEHPAPSGWIYEDVSPPRFEGDPAAVAHAQREYHKETEVPEPKVGGYSPFDEWSQGIRREYPDDPMGSFHEKAREMLAEGEAMARDIIRALPEEDWPAWVHRYVHDQIWGKPEPIKLPNPPSPMDDPRYAEPIRDWSKIFPDDPEFQRQDTFPEDWTKQADSSLDASSDNWWGPQSVNLNQVDVPGEAPGLQDDPDYPGKHIPTDQNWIYVNGKVAFGGHWWDLAHNLASDAGLPYDQAKYISNMVARNQLPEGYDVAIGEMHGQYPRIWMTNADRNAVWDSVMRELQERDRGQRIARVSSLFS